MSKLKISLVGLGQRGMVHLKSLGRLSDEDLIEIAAIAESFGADIEAVRSAAKNVQFTPPSA